MDISEVRAKFPQYSDMSDGELASALHKKYYADIPPEEFAAKIGLSQPEAPKPQRSVGQEAGRQAGLTARYALEGPMQLFNSVIGDPVNTAINYGIRGVNSLIPRELASLVTGKHGIPELGMPSEVTKRNYDQVFPTPETPTENVVGAISRGLSGGGLTTAAALRAPSALQSIPMIRSILAAPTVDLVSSGVGGGAAEIAKEAGGGPAWQLAAGIAGPMALGGANSAIKMAAQIPNEIRRPLTRGGAEQIAADTLGRIAQDKSKAVENLSRYNQLVERGEQVGSPGFHPTSGAVSADYGLVGGQQVIARGDANPQFAGRAATNNEAHATDLGRLNATDKQVELYKQKRDKITGPMREQVFANAKRDVDYTPVAEKIGELVSTPAGGRAESQKAFDWLAKRLDTYADQGRTDAANAYALHQDIGALIAGKVSDSNGSAIRLAGGLANEVKKTLAEQIDQAAPGFKKYLEHYSRLSKPIERLEVIKDRLGGQELSRVTNAMPQVTGGGATFTVSQAQMRNAVKDIKSETNLAPRQRDILERVLGDLNSETFASRGGKMPGSDTYQNMASANFVNRILGETIGSSGFGKAVQAPFNLAMRPFESRINDLIVRAYQDPKLMEELLRKARTSRGSPSLAGLLEFSTPRAAGGLLGAFSQ